MEEGGWGIDTVQSTKPIKIVSLFFKQFFFFGKLRKKSQELWDVVKRNSGLVAVCLKNAPSEIKKSFER